MQSDTTRGPGALVVAAPASASTPLEGMVAVLRGIRDHGPRRVRPREQRNAVGSDPVGQWLLRLGPEFRRQHGRVRVPDSSSLEPPSAVSVGAFVKANGSPGDFKYIVAKGASGCIASSYALYTASDGGLEFYVAQNSGLSYTLSPDAGSSIWDGNWHFVVGTYDGSAVRLYVDGNQVGNGAPRPVRSPMGCRTATTCSSGITTAARDWTTPARSTSRRSGVRR